MRAMTLKKQKEIAEILKNTGCFKIWYNGKYLEFEKLATKITNLELIVDLACNANLVCVCDFFLNKINDEEILIKTLFDYGVSWWQRWSCGALEQVLSKIKNEQLLKKAIDRADSIFSSKLMIINLLSNVNILLELSLSESNVWIRETALQRIKELRERKER